MAGTNEIKTDSLTRVDPLRAKLAEVFNARLRAKLAEVFNAKLQLDSAIDSLRLEHSRLDNRAARPPRGRERDYEAWLYETWEDSEWFNDRQPGEDFLLRLLDCDLLAQNLSWLLTQAQFAREVDSWLERMKSKLTR